MERIIQNSEGRPSGGVEFGPDRVPYTSAEIHAREISNLFLKHWLFAGRSDQLERPGDFKAVETPGGPILLARGEDGQLRAFANTCSHRGCRLATGEGNRKRLVCPYHAWTYALDGRLTAARGMDEIEGFRREDYGLIELPFDTWEGFCFIRFASEGMSLAEHLGDMPDVFASHNCRELACVKTASFDLACNWKLVLENALEDYHAGIVHRNSIGAQIALQKPTRGNWDSLFVRSERAVGVLPGDATSFPFIDTLRGEAREGSYFTVVYPNTQLCFTQDSVWWLSLRPIAPDRSVLDVGYCFPKSVTSRPDFAETAERYFKRWHLTAIEDNAICEEQQAGMNSVLRRAGPLAPREGMVNRFNRRLENGLSETA